LDYLRRRLGAGDLRYREPPATIPHGWETHVFCFQLQSHQPLPSSYRRPLVARGYCSPNALTRIRQEFAWQLYLAAQGYPVAHPLFVEEGGTIFGGPFMLMRRAAGETLLDVLLHQFPSIWWAPARMAEVHARLHRLAVPDFAAGRAPFLERSLAGMETTIAEYDLRGLAPGLDWLKAHRPRQPRSESILHLDFHPVNLIFDGRRCRAVLDWSEADVGDRHADVAKTLVLIESAPVELERIIDKVATLVGKSLLEHWYVQAYRKLLPLDEQRLRYYVAWAAFGRLCAWGRWLRASPLVTGGKPSSIRYLRADRIDFLRRAFHKQAEVAVRLRRGAG
jgi:aminoglycoside phosphotransferase (APT) family kinase protein